MQAQPPRADYMLILVAHSVRRVLVLRPPSSNKPPFGTFNSLRIRISGISWISRLFEGHANQDSWDWWDLVCVLNEHKPSTNKPHTSAQDLERQARNVFLTVDGNKFAKDSNSNA